MCSALFSRLFVVLLISFASASSFAAVTADDMTCGKDVGISLAEFKSKLASTCDLSKPFSSSLSRLLNEETYFFCCQKAK